MQRKEGFEPSVITYSFQDNFTPLYGTSRNPVLLEESRHETTIKPVVWGKMWGKPGGLLLRTNAAFESEPSCFRQTRVLVRACSAPPQLHEELLPLEGLLRSIRRMSHTAATDPTADVSALLCWSAG